MNQSRAQVIFAGLLVVFAVATRIIFNQLHVYNFNAVMAAGLFAGAYLNRSRFGFLIPMAAMLVTDAVIGVYDWKLMVVVYGALLFSFVLGRLYAKDATLLRYTGAVLGGSLTFFLATNVAVWIFGDGTFYPHTLAGLGSCLSMGLPFYRNTLLGDLTWTTVLFGGYELFRLKATSNATSSAAAVRA